MDDLAREFKFTIGRNIPGKVRQYDISYQELEDLIALDDWPTIFKSVAVPLLQ